METTNDFVRRLDTTSPQARTHFERCFCDTQGLYQELCDVGNQLDPYNAFLGVATVAGPNSFASWHHGSWLHQTMSWIASANTPGGNGSSKPAVL